MNVMGMYVGLVNPNAVTPLEKLTIRPENQQPFEVLYNPQSYSQSFSTTYDEKKLANGTTTSEGENKNTKADSETLSFDLFFDTLSAGYEVGGSIGDRARFEANKVLPAEAAMDVRQYTNKIYNLMKPDPSSHRPPTVTLSWSSLCFVGHLVSCNQKFTKFNGGGTPVRATLSCTFRRTLEKGERISFESPDTTKYRTVHQGDSLWSLSAKEYGRPEEWREIAAANGLNNPRVIRTGDRLVLPALKK